MKLLLYLDLHSRKVCMSVDTTFCCDDPITDISRFRVDIVREGTECVLFSYDMFEVNKNGQMCIVLDDAMKDLCPGRYLFNVMFDGCVPAGSIRFKWASTPVITDVTVESHAFESCDDACEVSPKLPPKSNCDCDEPCEPCDTCDDPCVYLTTV